MIALVNAQSTSWRQRLPLSIMAIGATLEGKYAYQILDGNLDHQLGETLALLIAEEDIRYVGFTVMPGVQLTNTIILSRRIRDLFPHVKIIWGGYFPSLQTKTVLTSQYVDYVIRDQGDYAFVALIEALESGKSLSSIKGLSYRFGNEVVDNPKQEIIDPNLLLPVPYHRVPVDRYIGRTYLGSRTINYHSSVGCPFLCGFCAVASVYKARWLGLTAERIATDLIWFNKDFGVNAVEFHDNNFFTSEKRTREFSERMAGRGISWWGEARPDTLMAYNDRTWQLMKQAGCKMIFFGAESSSATVLSLMDKGGTQTPDTVVQLVKRMKHVGIVPELSFVLGSPTETIDEDLERDFAYIKHIKQLNPETEIILYVYSPVFFEDSTLFQAAKSHAFRYPENLDDWLLPTWQVHDLRKNPVTPWLSPAVIRRIKNFERVLNARYPTNSDLKLSPLQRKTLKLLGSWRYATSAYALPYDIAVAQRLFRYRQPEIEGF